MNSQKRNISRIILILLNIYSPLTIFSQTDNEFWFVAPAVTHNFIPPGPLNYNNLNQPVALYFTIATGTATVKIEQPANPAFIPIYKTVTNSIAAEVLLTSFLSNIENTPADTVLNKGLLITSDQPITAVYEIQSPYNAATYSLLGKNALGTEFIIPSQNHYNNYPYADPPARNVFDIVASEDSTIITIIPKANIIGHLANDTFQIMLNRGQTWSGRAASGDSSAHLGGSFVISNKPIAVTFTDDAVQFLNPSAEAVDITGDQLLPRKLAKREFIVHSEDYHTSLVYCYAFEDSTTVNFNDSIDNINKIINRGEFAQFVFDTINSTVMQSASIHATKPILVYYFGGFGLTFPTFTWVPQAFSAIVPSTGCGGSKRVCFTRTPPGGLQNDWHWIIITKNGCQSSFSFQPVGPTLLPSSFVPVPGTLGEYVLAIGSFGGWPLYQTIVMTNPKGSFNVAFRTTDFVTSTVQYGKYSFSTQYSNLNLGCDKHICPGDSTILDAGYGRDSYLWNTGDTTETIWIKNPGLYWVTINQDSCTLSDTIAISYYWTNPINLGPDRVLCAGSNIVLDAGPGRAWYLWSNGDTTQTITVTSAGTYWVKAEDVHCTVYDTINISWMNSIDIGPDRNICPGDSALLSAPSGMTTYQWNIGQTTQSIWAKNAQKYKVTVTQGTCIFSDSLMVFFNPVPTVNLGVDTNICLGQTHMFDAGFCAGCTYSWDDLTTNQMNIGTSQTYTTGIAGEYRVTVTGANGCKGKDTIQLFTNAGVPVTINITGSANNVCQGTSVIFYAHTTNGGTSPAFQWKVNGGGVGPNDSIYTYVPLNGDIVSCVITSSNLICVLNNPATSNSITMVVHPNLPVSVVVSPSQNPVCAGTSVTFTATPTNGGPTPFYQWKVNGAGVGTSSPNYSYIPNNGDIVTCILTSDTLCPTSNPATSNAVTMTVNPNLPVSVSIATPTNPFCLGSSVTFTASPVNGGATPIYQWYVNGISQAIVTSVFTYVPAGGDVVHCTLNSSLMCVSGNPATSNSITMVVNTGSPAGITIAASSNPFCPGASVTFTATPINGGANPSYQWKVNGGNVGAGSSSYTYNPITGDSVRCIMQSNLPCVTGNPASSVEMIMSGTLSPIVTFTACFDTITTVNAKPIKLKGGIPLGGIYTGPGVNSITSTFNPAIAGVGTKTISYTYTNVSLCSAAKTKTIVVQAVPAFTCGNNLTDIRDGKIYSTVQIGTQCWFAEDLNYGSEIPFTQNQRDNCSAEKYHNPASSIQHPASVYQWDELMQYIDSPAEKGLCPPAWHVPTENDWLILFSNYTNNAMAGSPLKYSGYSGFNALLQGANHLNRQWDYPGFATFYWSSTSHGPIKAWAHGMNDPDPSVSSYPSLRTNAFSVRCIKD